MLLRLGVCFGLRVCFEATIITRLKQALSPNGSFFFGTQHCFSSLRSEDESSLPTGQSEDLK